jgi:hypothetical protein
MLSMYHFKNHSDIEPIGHRPLFVILNFIKALIFEEIIQTL